MASFIGCHKHSFDEKNRLMIPRRLRERLAPEREGAGFYITRGLEKCLAMYTSELTVHTWDLAVATGKFMRQFYGNAEHVEMDKQGRVLLTEGLKAIAALKRDVVLVGVGKHIEIWDANRWDTFMKESDDQYEDFASKALPSL